MNATRFVTLAALLLCASAMGFEKGEGRKGMDGQGPGGGGQRKPFDMVLNHAKELDLTEDQKNKFLAMQKEEEGKMEQDRAAMREKMNERSVGEFIKKKIGRIVRISKPRFSKAA